RERIPLVSAAFEGAFSGDLTLPVGGSSSHRTNSAVLVARARSLRNRAGRCRRRSRGWRLQANGQGLLQRIPTVAPVRPGGGFALRVAGGHRAQGDMKVL